MTSSRTKLSWPVAVLAAFALVLASLATVGGSYAAAGVTAKQVRKIAAKVVENKAKTLTVKTARNAEKLGGQAPATYRDYAVMTSIEDSNAVSAGDSQIANPVGITIPAGIGYVHVTASASLTGGNAVFALWFQMDGSCSSSGGLGYDTRQFGTTGTTQDSVSLTQLVSVSPGVHTFRLCVQTSAATTANFRTLVVETVALAGN